MGRKKKHEEHENLERWLVSYADFITLLFATFTALYAMAKMDTDRLKDLEKYIQQGFQQQSIVSGVKAIFSSENKTSSPPSDPSLLPPGGQGVLDFQSLTFKSGETNELVETIDKLNEDLKEINQAIANEGKAKGPSEDGELAPKGIDVTIQERGLKISFDSRLLFEPGSAALKQESYKTMAQIAERLKKFNKTHTIQIEGHTDDLPITSAVYPSNWELSTGRASTVVRMMINKHGFSPTSMVAVGYGSSRPIDINITAEGRRRNRRVDIILYSKQVGEQTDPKAQKTREEKLIDSRKTKPTRQGQLIREESETPEGPAQVIFYKPDGSKTIITPQASPIELEKTDITPDVFENSDDNG